LTPEDIATEVRLSEEEVIALYLNMIAFDGDWDAHLDFLNRLDDGVSWKFDQVSLVDKMRRKDDALELQDTIRSMG
jgi:hypothetical protein